MTGQDLKECIAEVKYSAIPEKSKKMIMNVLYEKQMETEGGNSDAGSNNDGWIPCSERLPEDSLNSVIGWDDFRERCCFVQYYKGRWILGNDDDVVNIIAWRPLPEPYKESED